MERYSTWRDPGTGIAPFISPKPIKTETSPLEVAVVPLCWLTAVIRLLFVCVSLVIKLLLIDVLYLFQPVAELHTYLTHAVNASTCRAILVAFGYYYVHSEVPRAKNKEKPLRGRARTREKLIVANWSSPIDVFYLVFRFNCHRFLLPVLAHSPAEPSPKTGLKVDRVRCVGVVKVGFLGALMAIGRPPLVARPGREYLNLHDALQGTTIPTAIFPEGTSSNNRGVLRFTSPPLGGLRSLSPEVQIVSLRHEAPTPTLPSATAPGPSLLNPFGHLWRIANCLPLPRHLLVRAMPEADNPTFASVPNDEQFWQQCEAAVVALGRFKRTASIGAEEKFGFLSFQKSR